MAEMPFSLKTDLAVALYSRHVIVGVGSLLLEQTLSQLQIVH